MKKILTLISFATILVACNSKPTDESIEKMAQRRDSLQNVVLEHEKEIIQLNKQIALQDTSNSEEQLLLIRKIAQQKSRVVSANKKVKQLENELASMRTLDKLVPVAVKEMQPETFKHYLIAFGNVEARNYGQISPEMSGQIRTIHVQPGQYVKEGALLVSLNTDAIEDNIKAIQAQYDLAKSTFEKQQKLWGQGIGSEIQFLQSKTQKEALEAQLDALNAQKRMSQLRAPYNGYVDKIFPKEGELAVAGFPVLEFVNLDGFQIKADVSENYIDLIHKGNIVEVTFASLPDLTIETPIVHVAKVINKVSRTFQVELHIANKDNRIKPNMVSTIRINDFSSDNAFVVPSLVIRKDITGNYVYVAAPQNDQMKIQKKYVTPGLSFEDQTMIASGLNLGDKVVTKGFHLVSNGMPVNVVNE